MRPLYRCLIRLHPLPFRVRFQEEMLWLFDEAGGEGDGLWLVRDAALSLFRQWFLRPRNYSPCLRSMRLLLDVVVPLIIATNLIFFVHTFAFSILIGPLDVLRLITFPAISALAVLCLGIFRFLSLTRVPSDTYVWIKLGQ
jgi:uncharacterized protein YhhL (DUF1145 family)